MTTSTPRRKTNVPLAELISDVKPGFAVGERDSGGVIQVRMNNVDLDGNLDLEGVIRVPATEKQVADCSLSNGDVLFNNTNSTELVGKSALFRGHSEPVTYSNHFTRLRVIQQRLEPRYLARWLTRQQKMRVFEGLCTRWVGQSAVRTEKLLALEILLLPLPEQKRIADILDKADAIRRKRREATAQLAELIASQFLTVFGDPLTNPKRWEPGTFDDHLKLVQYGPRFFNESYSTDGIRIVRITDLDQQGNLDFSAMPRMTVSEKDRDSYILRPGDLLLARTGATVGKTALIDDVAPDCIAGAYFIRLRFTDRIRPLYAQLVLRSRPVQTIIAEKSRQSAQQNFNGPAIRALPLPAPPAELQDQFVEFHRKAMQSGRRFTETSRNVDDLFNSLVQRAFRGDL